MKTLCLMILALCSATVSAQASEVKREKELTCWREARSEIRKHAKVQNSAIRFWQGAIMGDGAASLEISMYLVKIDGSEQAYKLDYFIEGCEEPLNIDAFF